MSRIPFAIASLVLAASAQAAAILSLPDDSAGLAGGAVSLPLSALPANGILGVDIVVVYNAAVLTPTSVTKTSISSPFILTANLNTPGTMRISLFGTSPLSGSGPIADIQFDVIGVPGQTSPLDLTSGQINEGAIPATLDDGAFAVCTGPSPEVSGVALTKVPLTTLQWAGQTNGVYDVAGGDVAQLRVDGGSAGASCLANDRTVASFDDTRPDPSAGSAYYYLVRAQGPCAPGPYGRASSGAERAPTVDCP